MLISIRKVEALLRIQRERIGELADTAPSYYRPYHHTTRSGKSRHIDNPVGLLRQAQDRILQRVLAAISLPERMYGVTRGSIIDHAAAHVGQPVVVTLDIKECFFRTTANKVFAVFKNTVGCSPEIARSFTKLTTINGALPEGAPTSPLLAAAVLAPLFRDLEAFAGRHGLSASMFADDIALSGVHPQDVIAEVIGIIRRHGYGVRARKVHVMPAAARQRLPGTMVNRKVSVDRQYRRLVRRRIATLKGAPEIPEWVSRSIVGQIEHVAFVAPNQAVALRRLASRFLPAAGSDEGRAATQKDPCFCRRGRFEFDSRAALRSRLHDSPSRSDATVRFGGAGIEREDPA